MRIDIQACNVDVTQSAPYHPRHIPGAEVVHAICARRSDERYTQQGGRRERCRQDFNCPIYCYKSGFNSTHHVQNVYNLILTNKEMQTTPMIKMEDRKTTSRIVGGTPCIMETNKIGTKKTTSVTLATCSLPLECASSSWFGLRKCTVTSCMILSIGRYPGVPEDGTPPRYVVTATMPKTVSFQAVYRLFAQARPLLGSVHQTFRFAHIGPQDRMTAIRAGLIPILSLPLLRDIYIFITQRVLQNAHYIADNRHPHLFMTPLLETTLEMPPTSRCGCCSSHEATRDCIAVLQDLLSWIVLEHETRHPPLIISTPGQPKAGDARPYRGRSDDVSRYVAP